MAIEHGRPKHRHAELAQRVLSAAVLVPGALVLAWAGEAYFTAGLILLGAVVIAEWFRMISVPLSSIAFAVALAVLVAASIGADYRGAGFAALVLIVGSVLTAAAVTAVAAAGRTRRSVRFWAAGGLAYAGFGTVSFIALRHGDDGFAAILFVFAVSWATDVFAYFVGRTIGGPKLWPAVSPKKTWSGAIGGAVAAAAAGALLALGLSLPLTLIGVLIFCALSAIAQLGDLFESGAKRRFGIKDSSRLIPGHGGLMDRVDGLLAAGVLALVIGSLVHGPLEPAVGVLTAIGAFQ